MPFDSAALFQCSQAVALSLSRIDSSAVAIARLARSRLVAAQGAARALPVGRTDLLAVSARVGNVKNNDPSLIEPVTPS